MPGTASTRVTDRAEEFRSLTGHALDVRPLMLDDRAALDTFVRSLSPRSRRLRFFTPGKNLDPAQLEHFVDLDFRQRAAFVATLHGQPEIVAVGRYEQCEPGSAEVALTVADRLQGEGIGTELLHHLATHALENGIRVFTAYVLIENQEMFDVFRHSGYGVACEREGGVTLVTLSLTE